MYLVMAVTVKGKTGELGATTTNRLVNIGDFFTQQVGASRTVSGAVGCQECINAMVHHIMCVAYPTMRNFWNSHRHNWLTKDLEAVKAAERLTCRPKWHDGDYYHHQRKLYEHYQAHTQRATCDSTSELCDSLCALGRHVRALEG